MNDSPTAREKPSTAAQDFILGLLMPALTGLILLSAANPVILPFVIMPALVVIGLVCLGGFAWFGLKQRPWGLLGLFLGLALPLPLAAAAHHGRLWAAERAHQAAFDERTLGPIGVSKKTLVLRGPVDEGALAKILLRRKAEQVVVLQFPARQGFLRPADKEAVMLGSHFLRRYEVRSGEGCSYRTVELRPPVEMPLGACVGFSNVLLDVPTEGVVVETGPAVFRPSTIPESAAVISVFKHGKQTEIGRWEGGLNWSLKKPLKGKAFTLSDVLAAIYD